MRKIIDVWLILLVILAALCIIAKIAHGQEYRSALKIFRERCLPCHSGERPPNGLRLDTVDNMVRGGKRGQALFPREPDKSLVYLFTLPREDAPPKMPPNGALSIEERATIREWIERGAQQMSMSGQEP